MLLSKPIEDKYKRYKLRELALGDYGDLCEINKNLFFAPLRHGGPELFLYKALEQQKQAHRQIELGNACREEDERKEFYIGVADVQSNQLIGCVMLTVTPLPDHVNEAEIAYFIDPDYQRIHFATDATIQLLENFAEKLKISIISATVDPDNTPSKIVLARLGLVDTHVIPSLYLADPDLLESYDEHGRLQHRSRLHKEVDIETLFARAKDITKPDPLDTELRIGLARKAKEHARARQLQEPIAEETLRQKVLEQLATAEAKVQNSGESRRLIGYQMHRPIGRRLGC